MGYFAENKHPTANTSSGRWEVSSIGRAALFGLSIIPDVKKVEDKSLLH